MQKRERVLDLLNSVFDRKGKVHRGPELTFHCPFCAHHKRKLRVNVDTQQWHCWVCDAKGRFITNLIKKFKPGPNIFSELKSIYQNSFETYTTKSKQEFVKLPNEYKPLIVNSDGVTYGHAIKYLAERGITKDDIIKYNIGYCVDGPYAGRIIIPSYNANAKLNYFVARSIYPNKMKYKNPPVSKDVIIFELFINWNMPIVLCEGVFDAMAIKRNAIPLLGKTITDSLLKRLVNSNVPEIILALDPDALATSVKISQTLMRYGLNVSRLTLNDGDPSDIGFTQMQTELLKSTPVNSYELILQKIASGSI